MQVSVIIPNYNHASFLKRRIESVLEQTYQDIEIIILDDCSTDYSREIIEEYRGHPRVSQIIYNDTNTGSTFKQWYKGIHLAKGEVVWIAESDDWCENNFIETLMHGMQQSPGCVLAFAQSYCVDDAGEVRWQSNHAKATEYMSGKNFFEERLVYGCTIFNSSMAIFKKECALKVPDSFTNFKLCGDWFFWINIVRNGDVFISNKVLNYYRRSDTSLTSRYYASGYNFTEELRMFELVKAQKEDDSFLINDSIFNRYNSFQRKKSKLSSHEVKEINYAFHDFFGGSFLFHIFLLNKRIYLIVRKVKLRVKITLKNIRPLKAGTI